MIDQTREVQIFVILVKDAKEGVNIEQDEWQRHGEGLHNTESVGEHPRSVRRGAEAEHGQVDVPNVSENLQCVRKLTVAVGN